MLFKETYLKLRKMAQAKKNTTVRLTAEGEEIADRLMQKTKRNFSNLVEYALEEMARREGIIPEDPAEARRKAIQQEEIVILAERAAEKALAARDARNQGTST